jgi:hypothetical protein
MLLYLTVNNEEKFVDFEVEATVPMHDTFVLFFSTPFTCGLENGKNSDPYVEYFFKKVTHVCHCKKVLNGSLSSVTIGFYFNDNEMKPFVIHQESEDFKMHFGTSEDHGEHSYSFSKLFNYKEYKELSEMLGQPVLNFDEYIEKVVNGSFGHENFMLIDAKPSKDYNIKFSQLINTAEHMKLLNEQEKLFSSAV